MTVAARATAERKTLGHLSYRVATLRQSFSRPNMISICHLAAHVYMREKAVSALVVFHGLAARLPAWDAWLYPFVFQRFSEPVGNGLFANHERGPAAILQMASGPQGLPRQCNR